MTPAGRYDIAADSLAIIDAVHNDDHEALTYLLSVANQPGVIRFLAVLSEELIGLLGEHLRQDDSAMMTILRASYVTPPEGPT